MRNIIGKCPICHNDLKVVKLKCDECNTSIEGEFSLSCFDLLSVEQQNFLLIFIKNAGNIKEIEKELNISYPTVKRNLEELQISLGFKKNSKGLKEPISKDEIYDKLRKNKISFDEAEELLKEE